MDAYDQRIATRITRDADARLRFAALLRRRPLSALLTDLILGQLPPAPAEVTACVPAEATS